MKQRFFQKLQRLISCVVALLGMFLLTGFTLPSWLGGESIVLPPLEPVQSTLKTNTLWTRHAVGGNGGEFLMFKPSVDENHVYVSDAKGNVVSLNRETGKLDWSVHLKKAPLVAGPVLGEGQLFLSSSTEGVFSLDPATGKTLWHESIPGEVITRPSYGEGVVIVKNIDGVLFALDASKGKLLWRYEEGAPRLLLQGGSAPVIEGGVVLAAFANAKLVILNLKNGKLIWQSMVAQPNGLTELTRMVDVRAKPTIVDGVIYVVSYQGNVSAIRLESAELLWMHPLSSITGAAVSSDTVYVSDTEGYVWAFDKSNGQVLWQQQGLKGRTLTRPVILGNYVMVADLQGLFHWLSVTDGHFVERQSLSKKGFVVAPLVMDDIVYLQDKDGTVTAEQLAS